MSNFSNNFDKLNPTSPKTTGDDKNSFSSEFQELNHENSPHQTHYINQSSEIRKEKVFGGKNKTYVDESSRNGSFSKVVITSLVTVALATCGIVYNLWTQKNDFSPTNEISTTNEKFADVSDEAASFVKNSVSKVPGTTLEQALASYLNVSIGQDWQALGWKSSFQQKTTYSVSFVWKQGEERKEAIWQVDLQNKTITPANFIAEEITPVSPVNNGETQTKNDQQNTQPTK